MKRKEHIGKLSRPHLLEELLTAVRFGIIGIAATAVHIGVVWLLVAYTPLPVLLANLMAFICAFGLSFIGNYRWTFSSPGAPTQAMQRFFLISLAAFIANSTLLAALLAGTRLSPHLAAIASASVVPGLTFLASRFWGFRQQP